MAEDEVNKLMERLQADSFIRIYTTVNPSSPYRIPKTVLEGQSECFATYIQQGVFDFHLKQDDGEIWKTCLYWLVEHKLRQDMFPTGKLPDLEFSIDCYILGQRYGLKAFQDEIMLYLLEASTLGDRSVWLVPEAMLLAFQKTSPGSKLRDLLVEEALREQKQEGEPFGMAMEPHEISEFEGLGFSQLFTSKWQNSDFPGASRFDTERCEARFFWKTYMVGPAEEYEIARLKQIRDVEQRV